MPGSWGSVIENEKVRDTSTLIFATSQIVDMPENNIWDFIVERSSLRSVGPLTS
jgi:hypothetical protein